MIAPAVDSGRSVGQPNDMGQVSVPTAMKGPGRPVPSVAGFERITGQRIVLDAAGRAECTVFGRRHRRPVERQVSLGVAADLARKGVRTVVRTPER